MEHCIQLDSTIDLIGQVSLDWSQALLTIDKSFISDPSRSRLHIVWEELSRNHQSSVNWNEATLRLPISSLDMPSPHNLHLRVIVQLLSLKNPAEVLARGSSDIGVMVNAAPTAGSCFIEPHTIPTPIYVLESRLQIRYENWTEPAITTTEIKPEFSVSLLLYHTAHDVYFDTLTPVLSTKEMIETELPKRNWDIIALVVSHFTGIGTYSSVINGLEVVASNKSTEFYLERLELTLNINLTNGTGTLETLRIAKRAIQSTSTTT